MINVVYSLIQITLLERGFCIIEVMIAPRSLFSPLVKSRWFILTLADRRWANIRNMDISFLLMWKYRIGAYFDVVRWIASPLPILCLVTLRNCHLCDTNFL